MDFETISLSSSNTKQDSEFIPCIHTALDLLWVNKNGLTVMGRIECWGVCRARASNGGKWDKCS